MNVNELAANNNLGSLIKEFKPELISRQYISGLSIGIPLCFVILVGLRGLDLSTALIFTLILFLITTCIYLAIFVANKDKQLFIYENGFIYIDARQLITKYEDVNEILQQVTTTYFNGIPTPTQYKYTIYIKNKIKPLYLTNIFPNIQEAGDYIQSQILQQQLPIVRNAYFRGENVRFGSLIVNQNGIKVEKQTLTWGQIKNIRVVKGHVVLDKERSNLLLNIAAIPNIYVFLNLIYEIMPVTQAQIRTPIKGNDIIINVKISQAEAISGLADKDISFLRWETCDECNGSGLDNQGNNCFVCLGEGQNQVAKKIAITIPPHSVAGECLTIIGEGNAGRRGGAPGDLYINLEINTIP